MNRYYIIFFAFQFFLISCREEKSTDTFVIQIHERAMLIQNTYTLTTDSISVKKTNMSNLFRLESEQEPLIFIDPSFSKKLNETEKNKINEAVEAINFSQLNFDQSNSDYNNNNVADCDLEFEWTIRIKSKEIKIDIYKEKIDQLFFLAGLMNEILPEDFTIGYTEEYLAR